MLSTPIAEARRLVRSMKVSVKHRHARRDCRSSTIAMVAFDHVGAAQASGDAWREDLLRPLRVLGSRHMICAQPAGLTLHDAGPLFPESIADRASRDRSRQALSDCQRTAHLFRSACVAAVALEWSWRMEMIGNRSPLGHCRTGIADGPWSWRSAPDGTAPRVACRPSTAESRGRLYRATRTLRTRVLIRVRRDIGTPVSGSSGNGQACRLAASERIRHGIRPRCPRHWSPASSRAMCTCEGVPRLPTTDVTWQSTIDALRGPRGDTSHRIAFESSTRIGPTMHVQQTRGCSTFQSPSTDSGHLARSNEAISPACLVLATARSTIRAVEPEWQLGVVASSGLLRRQQWRRSTERRVVGDPSGADASPEACPHGYRAAIAGRRLFCHASRPAALQLADTEEQRVSCRADTGCS